MATRYIGSTGESPLVQGSLVIGAASGGTLAGSQKVQVVFDDTIFGSAQEGKQRLIAAVEVILERIKSAREWPISSAS